MDRDALDTVCMHCKERFGRNRRAYICNICKGGFCESCGVTRVSGTTCSSCIAQQCQPSPKTSPNTPSMGATIPQELSLGRSFPKYIGMGGAKEPPSAGRSPHTGSCSDRSGGAPLGQWTPPNNGGADTPTDRSYVLLAQQQPQKRMQRAVRHRKVCILGHISVGKSAIVSRYVDDKFVSYHNPTVSTLVSRSAVVHGDVYNVGILDTAGQDEYAVFKPQWSIGTHGYVLVYSVTDASSFEALHTIRSHLLDCHAPDVPIVLCGNKADAPEADVQVSIREGFDLAAKWNSVLVMCSAKTGENVGEVFMELLKRIALTV